MSGEVMSAVLLDPVRWEEREARRAERDEPLPSSRSASPAPRDPRELALEWIADRQARFQAGQDLHRSDLAYVLVLALRHKLPLAREFEAALRRELDWPAPSSPPLHSSLPDA